METGVANLPSALPVGDIENALYKTPTFEAIGDSSQVTISDASPSFFNLQVKPENKVFEVSKSPFLMKEEHKGNLRFSNSHLNRIRKVNLTEPKKTGLGSAFNKSNDFQYIYSRYIKYKSMMERLKKRIMDELSKNTQFNQATQEAVIKKSCFEQFEEKLSLVTDKLQYYTYKLKKAGVEVNDKEIEDMKRISPDVSKEELNPKQIKRTHRITSLRQSLDISTPKVRKGRGKNQQKFRSLSIIPHLKGKKRMVRDFRIKQTSIDYTNRGPARLRKSIILNNKQRIPRTIITINSVTPRLTDKARLSKSKRRYKKRPVPRSHHSRTGSRARSRKDNYEGRLPTRYTATRSSSRTVGGIIRESPEEEENGAEHPYCNDFAW
ncbi:unnamed protein product [Moneuplotes crassus]|uniref:Uncharacterized protein n=1 Tax=Euplotes crassus TaxID=5936 RepID=A0AAD1XEG1_EUPCR|nr:unnamed protein product [Moneuplotes crassus]